MVAGAETSCKLRVSKTTRTGGFVMQINNPRHATDPVRTNGYLVHLFASVALLFGWVGVETSAQTASIQSHVAKAKAAAYEPGYDFTVLYDYMCRPALP